MVKGTFTQKEKGMYEILSPAGNMEKLKTAVYFGANAVYFAGKQFGLRAGAGNFDYDEIKEAVGFCHKNNVKVYVTLNIIAHNDDFNGLKEYIQFLDAQGVDGVIVSDIGVMSFVKKYSKNLELHVSTQANVTNKYIAKFYADMGAKRIVLARELTLSEIKEIKDYANVELEAFVHGAMCISYSGRCLLSNFLTNRDGNRGECVQACRWEYEINEVSRPNQKLPIQEDNRGTYILNSKDLNMIEHLKDLIDAGVTSFKIEGRMKTSYYVATTTNAYRRALDDVLNNREFDESLLEELNKASNRTYTTGFYYKNKRKEQSENLQTSAPTQTYDFVAIVRGQQDTGLIVEQRNRFKVGDILEILSPSGNFNKSFVVQSIINERGEVITDAKNVQQNLIINCPFSLQIGDILRKKKRLKIYGAIKN